MSSLPISVEHRSPAPRACSPTEVARGGCQLGLVLVFTLGVVVPAAAQDDELLGEVFVTAQKREQSLQEVPVSITVFSEELIEKLNVSNFADFADSVPGVTYATTGVGNSQYFIRGIGQVGQGQSPTTGVYLDEVPLQTHSLRSSSQPDPQLFDVARMEVLRGPQGVLFGSSAMGGTLRIITNQPDPSQFQSKVDVGVATIKDGSESWDAKAMVNVPLVNEVLALRLVGITGHQGGWVDDLRPVTANLTENLNNPNAIEEDANSADYSTARAALRYSPTDTLSITPSIFYQDTQSDTDRAHSDPTLGLESRTKARYQDVWAKDRFVISNLLIEKKLAAAGGLSILSSSSYLDRDTDLFFDSTAFRHPQVAAIVGPTPAGQLYWSASAAASKTEQFTQEIRAVSTSESPLQYLFGLYYKTLELAEYRNRPSLNLYGATAPLPFGASVPPKLEEIFNIFEEDEYAAFGEISYWLTDHWQLSLGGRYFSYDQTDSRRRYGVGGEAGGNLTFAFVEKADESDFTPRVAISYQPNKTLNLYTSFSSGFRTGGVNSPIPDDVCTPAERAAAGLPDTPPPFKSDTTDNLEIGAKTSWLDGRARLDVAAYSIDWKDFQQSAQTTCGPNPVMFTANAGEVSVDGAEVELSLQVTDGFRLDGGMSYTDAIYKEPFTTLGLPAGTSLLDVPEFTWNVRGEYAFPIGQSWDGSVMVSAHYVDDTISGFGEGEVVLRPSYTLVDLRFALERETLSLVLFADNVTDEIPVYGQEFATSPTNTTATSFFSNLIGPPRTIGLRAIKKF